MDYKCLGEVRNGPGPGHVPWGLREKRESRVMKCGEVAGGVSGCFGGGPLQPRGDLGNIKIDSMVKPCILQFFFERWV